MGKLTGKIAVVTGASRGIGAAIAQRLAADGASVVVNYNQSAKGAEEVVKEITAAGGTAAAIQGDVANSAQVKGLFAEIKKRFGRVDILVNNAGVWRLAPLAEYTPEHFREVMSTNVEGALQASAEALKLIPAASGRIINISSIAARTAMAGAAVYCASKAALDALTLNWALELGPRNITVNAVAPGVTETDMVAGAPEEFKNELKSKTPLGRLGRAEDIADVVAFLASDDARWVTGHTIDASGGLRP